MYNNTEIAQSRAWGIFLRDTVYFIVIQWNMTLIMLHWITMEYAVSRMKTGLRNLCNVVRAAFHAYV